MFFFFLSLEQHVASTVAQTVKSLPAMQETQVRSQDWEDPLEKGMTTRSVFLCGEFRGPRSLAGYSPWGLKESDMTEWPSRATKAVGQYQTTVGQ